jgi:glycosyltransferase involved in cell wall biosynthesis
MRHWELILSDKRIAILIPSFRDARILRTISSIKRADPQQFSRIYVLDGGSNMELVSQIGAELRSDDICVSEPDRGIFDALNKGLNASPEDIIGWIGSDDYYTANVHFEEIVRLFDLQHLDCYIFDKAYTSGTSVRRITQAVNPSVLNFRFGRIVPHFSSFWARSAIGSTRFKLDYPNAADQKFFLELASRRALKVYLDKRIGTVMRLGGASTGSFRHILKGNVHTFEIFREHMGFASAGFAVVMKLAWKVLDTCRQAVVRPSLPI